MQPGGTTARALDSAVRGAGMRQQGAEAGTRDRPATEGHQQVVTSPGDQPKRSRRAPQGTAGVPRGAADAGKGGQPKRRKTEAERADKLDSLVAQYRAQIFGGTKGKASSQEAAKSSMQRWFE